LTTNYKQMQKVISITNSSMLLCIIYIIHASNLSAPLNGTFQSLRP